jgi:hypothetical protein
MLTADVNLQPKLRMLGALPSRLTDTVSSWDTGHLHQVLHHATSDQRHSSGPHPHPTPFRHDPTNPINFLTQALASRPRSSLLSPFIRSGAFLSGRTCLQMADALFKSSRAAHACDGWLSVPLDWPINVKGCILVCDALYSDVSQERIASVFRVEELVACLSHSSTLHTVRSSVSWHVISCSLVNSYQASEVTAASIL